MSNYCKIPIYNKQERLLKNMLRRVPVTSKLYPCDKIFKLRSLPSGITASRNTLDIYGRTKTSSEQINFSIWIGGRIYHRDTVPSNLIDIKEGTVYDTEITASNRNFTSNFYYVGSRDTNYGNVVLVELDSDNGSTELGTYTASNGVYGIWHSVCEKNTFKMDEIDTDDLLRFSFKISSDFNVSFINNSKGIAKFEVAAPTDVYPYFDDIHGVQVIGNEIEDVINDWYTVQLGDEHNDDYVYYFYLNGWLDLDYTDGTYLSMEIASNTPGVSLLRNKCLIDVTNPEAPVVTNTRVNDPDCCFDFDELDWIPVTGGNFSIGY